MITQKLKLGKYPYTYARVSVMRSFLITKEDYRKLLKMSLNEIISFLQNSQYKQAIDELGVTYSGVELLEMALNKNLVETWNKLKQTSTQEVKIIINSYLERADLWNIKAILRGLHANAPPETIKAFLLPAGSLTNKLDDFLNSASVEEFLRKLETAGMKLEFQQALEKLKSDNTITELENVIDKSYYDKIIKFSKSIPSEGKLFRQFLESEISTLNTLNVLRFKRAGMDKAAITSYIIGMPSETVKRILKSTTDDETAKVLSEQVSESALETFQNNDLTGIELDLEKNLLKKTQILLHQHPLTVDVILGYMFAKEVEVRNLKILLKSRQLNLSEEFIEQQIII